MHEDSVSFVLAGHDNKLWEIIIAGVLIPAVAFICLCNLGK